MAFADSFDMAYTIWYDLHSIVNRRVPLSMYTDSLSIFHVLTKAHMTNEKRLMIDLKCVKNSYKRIEIYYIAHDKSEHNIADALKS